MSDYLPWHPYGPRVHVRHLLNQTSGIPNPAPTRWIHSIDEPGFDEREALSAVLARHPKLKFEPGDRYAYSNISYWLLGRLIEAATGQPYHEYLRKFIFQPIGIGSSDAGCGFADTDEFATGYYRRRSIESVIVHVMAKPEHLRTGDRRWGGFAHVQMNGMAYGGISGTARGYGMFLRDQLGEQSELFSAETKQLFYSPQLDNRHRVLPMTLGWLRGSLNGQSHFGKPGGGPGFQSNLRIYPNRGLATVFLANRIAFSESQIARFSDEMDGLVLSATNGSFG